MTPHCADAGRTDSAARWDAATATRLATVITAGSHLSIGGVASGRPCAKSVLHSRADAAPNVQAVWDWSRPRSPKTFLATKVAFKALGMPQ